MSLFLFFFRLYRLIHWLVHVLLSFDITKSKINTEVLSIFVRFVCVCHIFYVKTWYLHIFNTHTSRGVQTHVEHTSKKWLLSAERILPKFPCHLLFIKRKIKRKWVVRSFHSWWCFSFHLDFVSKEKSSSSQVYIV